MKMYFYSKNYDFERWSPPNNIEYPAIVLYEDSWDDFGYKTSYHVRFFDSPRESEKIGFLGILQKDEKTTNLPPKFTELTEDYCSLGAIDYYYQLKKCFKKDAINILQKLRDCAINEEIKKNFVHDEGFKVSLLRSTGSEKALTEGKGIIDGHSRKFNSSFTFNCVIGNFENKHSISFDFERERNEFLPHRISCLIGKNGTGKTQYLSKLAMGMSGQDIELKKGFQPGRPLFSQVIAISYSIFDSFKKPNTVKILKEYGERFNYIYCGLRKTDDSIQSYREIQSLLSESILKIDKMGKIEEWLESLSSLFHKDRLLELIHEIAINQNVNVMEFLHVSSGQGIILSCVTNLYANITKETLIIYDEPETHLHPNAIYQLISILHEILNKTNSYAIIATHSPIIVQQIPSKYVRILSQMDNYVEIRQPGLETFGESLTALTNEIFGNNMNDEYYKKVLEKIASTRGMLRGDINIDELFEGDLSLNARIFYEGKRNEIERR
jgi:predicted ATPase